MRNELVSAARRLMKASSYVNFIERWWLGCLEGEEVLVRDDELSGVIGLWKACMHLHRELMREGSGGLQCVTGEVIRQFGRSVYRSCEVLMIGQVLPGFKGSVITADQVRRVKLFWRLGGEIAIEIVRVASASPGPIDVHDDRQGDESCRWRCEGEVATVADSEDDVRPK
jgi:hypothetical protein